MIQARSSSLLALAVLCGLSLWATDAPVAEKPALAPLTVRVCGPDGVLVLSHGPLPLAALRVRMAGGGGGLLRAAGDWAQVEALELNHPRLRELTFLVAVPGSARAWRMSVLLQARRTPDGVRLALTSGAMVPQARAGADPAAELPPEAEGLSFPPGAFPLEMALEIFPHPSHPEAIPRLFSAGQGQGGPLARGGLEAPGGGQVRRIWGSRLSFEAAGGLRTEIARSAPVEWILREQDGAVLLVQRLLPDPRQPLVPGSHLLYLGCKWDAGQPELGPLRLNKNRTPVHDYLEGSLQVYAGGADVFAFKDLTVFAQIAYPAGREGGGAQPEVKMLPCFFWEAPRGTPAEGEFRFRFAPPRRGVYGIRMLAIAGTHTTRGEAVAIEAGPAASAGMVRVREGERVFRLDEGGVWFPVGLNLAWPRTKGEVGSYLGRFRELARNGGNATRIWLSSWGLPLERERAGAFDPDVAQALDQLLLEAQARELRLILVAENAYDLSQGAAEHPYFRERGGTVLATPEFFRDETAARYFKTRLTYLAARYGAFRSLWAWELLNEPDEAWPAVKSDPEDPRTGQEEADRSRVGRRTILKWVTEMAEHLQAMDPHAHPVTVSLALPPERPWKELEQLATLGFLQAHGYVPLAEEAKENRALDEASLIEEWARGSRLVGRARRPLLLGEFGYWAPGDTALREGGAEAERVERNLRDTEGVLLHNALMAGLASGLAGTPMAWWWDRSVERHGLWRLFRGPAEFAAALGALATREGPERLRLLSNRDEPQAGVRVLGRVGVRGMCVWVQDLRSTWSARLERGLERPPRVARLELSLPALQAGRYRVRWLDTWQGGEVGREERAVEAFHQGGTAAAWSLVCPGFVRDLGLVIEPLGTGD